MPDEIRNIDNAEHSGKKTEGGESLGRALFQDSYSNMTDGRKLGTGQKSDGDRPTHADTALPVVTIVGGDGSKK